MKLGTDMPRTEIQDPANGSGMVRGNPKELATLQMWMPFWQFLTILKVGVKDINGTTPNVSALKMDIIWQNLAGAKQLQRGGSRPHCRYDIPQVDSILQGKRPQRQVSLLRPVNNAM
jgi:hypothetical protein